MARSTNLRRGRSNSALQPPDNAKRLRKPTARANPPASPPPPPKRAPKKKATAARKPNTPSPTATESVIEVGVDSDGTLLDGLEVGPVYHSSPAPDKPPHPVHFQCTVLLDGKDIKQFGKTVDINAEYHMHYNAFERLAEEYIKGFMEKRGGVVRFYKGPWRANWGALKEPFRHDLDNIGDWQSLEENLRHRAQTSGGVRNAGRVDIKLHFKTHGNADSSPPPPLTQTDVSMTQTRAKSKAKPHTIRQGNPSGSVEGEILVYAIQT
jgi:hypothetical protein